MKDSTNSAAAAGAEATQATLGSPKEGAARPGPAEANSDILVDFSYFADLADIGILVRGHFPITDAAAVALTDVPSHLLPSVV